VIWYSGSAMSLLNCGITFLFPSKVSSHAPIAKEEETGATACWLLDTV
jgi:hypothetical protein